MLVILKSGIRHNDQDWKAGSQLNVSDDDAKRLIGLGVAVNGKHIDDEADIPDGLTDADSDAQGEDVDLLTVEEFSMLKEKEMEAELLRLNLPFKAKDTKPTLITIYENWLRSQV